MLYRDFDTKKLEHDYCWIVNNNFKTTLSAKLCYFKFLDKIVSMSTFRGFILARKGVTIFPEQLKTLSEGELVALTHRYLQALWERMDSFKLAVFHHNRRSSSKSSFGVRK